MNYDRVNSDKVNMILWHMEWVIGDPNSQIRHAGQQGNETMKIRWIVIVDLLFTVRGRREREREED